MSRREPSGLSATGVEQGGSVAVGVSELSDNSRV